MLYEICHATANPNVRNLDAYVSETGGHILRQIKWLKYVALEMYEIFLKIMHLKCLISNLMGVKVGHLLKLEHIFSFAPTKYRNHLPSKRGKLLGS